MHYVAKAYKKAGLPDGLFQVIHGHGEVGSQLVGHPSIKKVSLTGSVETEKSISRRLTIFQENITRTWRQGH